MEMYRPYMSSAYDSKESGHDLALLNCHLIPTLSNDNGNSKQEDKAQAFQRQLQQATHHRVLSSLVVIRKITADSPFLRAGLQQHCSSRDIVLTVNATALVPFVPVSQNVEQHQEVDRSTTHLHHTLTEQALSKKLLHFNNLTIVVFPTNFIFMKNEALQRAVLCQRSRRRSINTGPTRQNKMSNTFVGNREGAHSQSIFIQGQRKTLGLIYHG